MLITQEESKLCQLIVMYILDLIIPLFLEFHPTVITLLWLVSSLINRSMWQEWPYFLWGSDKLYEISRQNLQ